MTWNKEGKRPSNEYRGGQAEEEAEQALDGEGNLKKKKQSSISKEDGQGSLKTKK